MNSLEESISTSKEMAVKRASDIKERRPRGPFNLIRSCGVEKKCTRRTWKNKILLNCVFSKICTSEIERSKGIQMRREKIKEKLQNEKIYKKRADALLLQKCSPMKNQNRPKHKFLKSPPISYCEEVIGDEASGVSSLLEYPNICKGFKTGRNARKCHWLGDSDSKTDMGIINMANDNYVNRLKDFCDDKDMYAESVQEEENSSQGSCYSIPQTQYHGLIRNDITHTLLNDFKQLSSYLVKKEPSKMFTNALDMMSPCSFSFVNKKLKLKEEKRRKTKYNVSKHVSEMDHNIAMKENTMDRELSALIKSRLETYLNEEIEKQTEQEDNSREEYSDVSDSCSLTSKTIGVNQLEPAPYNLICQLVDDFQRIFLSKSENYLSESTCSMLRDDLVSDDDPLEEMCE